MPRTSLIPRQWVDKDTGEVYNIQVPAGASDYDVAKAFAAEKAKRHPGFSSVMLNPKEPKVVSDLPQVSPDLPELGKLPTIEDIARENVEPALSTIAHGAKDLNPAADVIPFTLDAMEMAKTAAADIPAQIGADLMGVFPKNNPNPKVEDFAKEALFPNAPSEPLMLPGFEGVDLINYARDKEVPGAETIHDLARGTAGVAAKYGLNPATYTGLGALDRAKGFRTFLPLAFSGMAARGAAEGIANYKGPEDIPDIAGSLLFTLMGGRGAFKHTMEAVKGKSPSVGGESKEGTTFDPREEDVPLNLLDHPDFYSDPERSLLSAMKVRAYHGTPDASWAERGEPLKTSEYSLSGMGRGFGFVTPRTEIARQFTDSSGAQKIQSGMFADDNPLMDMLGVNGPLYERYGSGDPSQRAIVVGEANFENPFPQSAGPDQALKQKALDTIDSLRDDLPPGTDIQEIVNQIEWGELPARHVIASVQRAQVFAYLNRAMREGTLTEPQFRQLVSQFDANEAPIIRQMEQSGETLFNPIKEMGYDSTIETSPQFTEIGLGNPAEQFKISDIVKGQGNIDEFVKARGRRETFAESQARMIAEAELRDARKEVEDIRQSAGRNPVRSFTTTLLNDPELQARLQRAEQKFYRLADAYRDKYETGSEFITAAQGPRFRRQPGREHGLMDSYGYDSIEGSKFYLAIASRLGRKPVKLPAGTEVIFLSNEEYNGESLPINPPHEFHELGRDFAGLEGENAPVTAPEAGRTNPADAKSGDMRIYFARDSEGRIIGALRATTGFHGGTDYSWGSVRRGHPGNTRILLDAILNGEDAPSAYASLSIRTVNNLDHLAQRLGFERFEDFRNADRETVTERAKQYFSRLLRRELQRKGTPSLEGEPGQSRLDELVSTPKLEGQAGANELESVSERGFESTPSNRYDFNIARRGPVGEGQPTVRDRLRRINELTNHYQELLYSTDRRDPQYREFRAQIRNLEGAARHLSTLRSAEEDIGYMENITDNGRQIDRGDIRYYRDLIRPYLAERFTSLNDPSIPDLVARAQRLNQAMDRIQDRINRGVDRPSFSSLPEEDFRNIEHLSNEDLISGAADDYLRQNPDSFFPAIERLASYINRARANGLAGEAELTPAREAIRRLADLQERQSGWELGENRYGEHRFHRTIRSAMAETGERRRTGIMRTIRDIPTGELERGNIPDSVRDDPYYLNIHIDDLREALNRFIDRGQREHPRAVELQRRIDAANRIYSELVHEDTGRYDEEEIDTSSLDEEGDGGETGSRVHGSPRGPSSFVSPEESPPETRLAAITPESAVLAYRKLNRFLDTDVGQAFDNMVTGVQLRVRQALAQFLPGVEKTHHNVDELSPDLYGVSHPENPDVGSEFFDRNKVYTGEQEAGGFRLNTGTMAREAIDTVVREIATGRLPMEQYLDRAAEIMLRNLIDTVRHETVHLSQGITHTSPKISNQWLWEPAERIIQDMTGHIEEQLMTPENLELVKQAIPHLYEIGKIQKNQRPSGSNIVGSNVGEGGGRYDDLVKELEDLAGESGTDISPGAIDETVKYSGLPVDLLEKGNVKSRIKFPDGSESEVPTSQLEGVSENLQPASSEKTFMDLEDLAPGRRGPGRPRKQPPPGGGGGGGNQPPGSAGGTPPEGGGEGPRPMEDWTAMDWARDVAQIPQSLRAGYDLSAFRNNFFRIATRPGLVAKHFKATFQALGSHEGYLRATKELSNPANADYMKLAQQARLNLVGEHAFRSHEAGFGSVIAEKIPGVQMSERSYSAPINVVRFDTFKSLIDWHGGPENVTPEVARRIARYTNAMTGSYKGKGRVEKLIQATAGLPWSGRNIAGRLELVNPAFYYEMAKSPKLLLSMSRDLGGTIALGSVGLYIAKKQLEKWGHDVKVYTNPTSTRFGEINVDGISYNIWGGASQPIKLIAQIASQKKTYESGTIELGPKGKKNPYGETGLSTLSTYFENKLAPVPKFLDEAILKRTNYRGEPISLGQAAWENLAPVPLAFEDMSKVLEERPEQLPAALGMGLLGMDVRLNKKRKTKRRSRERIY